MQTKAWVVRRGLCAKLVQSLVRCRRHKAKGLCAEVVRRLCAKLVQSLVRCRRHKAFALFRLPLFERHKAFDPCAFFISLIFLR